MAQHIISFPHTLVAVGQLGCCDGVGLSELPSCIPYFLTTEIYLYNFWLALRPPFFLLPFIPLITLAYLISFCWTGWIRRNLHFFYWGTQRRDIGQNTWVVHFSILFTLSTYLPYLCIYFLHPIFVLMECCINLSCKALWDRHNCPFDSLQPIGRHSQMGRSLKRSRPSSSVSG